MNLTPSTVPLVEEAMREALTPYLPDRVTGVSCIAVGADSIFARVILDLGGNLEVILPASDYREKKVKPENVDHFDQLVGRASSVRTMPFVTSNRDAYEAANNALLSLCGLLFAVCGMGWPGAGR